MGACSNILCLPPEVVDWIYFYILLIANTLNCLVGLASIYLVVRRKFFPRPRRNPTFRDLTLEAAPSVSVVVACYLPNEQQIIESTIDHILRKLDWPGAMTLHVVYNTPHEIPYERTLLSLDGMSFGPGRMLRVKRVDGSTSKAANLNFILPTLTVRPITPTAPRRARASN